MQGSEKWEEWVVKSAKQLNVWPRLLPPCAPAVHSLLLLVYSCFKSHSECNQSGQGGRGTALSFFGERIFANFCNKKHSFLQMGSFWL